MCACGYVPTYTNFRRVAALSAPKLRRPPGLLAALRPFREDSAGILRAPELGGLRNWVAVGELK